jgi:hypothetical protein
MYEGFMIGRKDDISSVDCRRGGNGLAGKVQCRKEEDTERGARAGAARFDNEYVCTLCGA